MNTLDNIKRLIKVLPKKDINLGYKFLLNRDFESLQSLVDSALIKVKKSQESDNPKEEYKDIDIDALSTLKAEIDIYYFPLADNSVTEEDEEE